LNAPGVECQARTLSEVQLQNLVLEAINKVLGGKQRAIKVLETNISEVLGNAYSEELERIRKQIEKQQTLLVKMTVASEDYSKVVDKIYALQKEQEEAMVANVNYKAGKERIQEMIEYLKSQPKWVTAYDEQLVRKLIEKITVYDDHLDFLFKSGIQIEIRG
jgi:site-specific DNA recombinase